MEPTNLPDILADHIDAVLEGKISTAEFLAKFPDDQEELAGLLDVAIMLNDAPIVRPRRNFQEAAKRRIMSQVVYQKAPITRPISARPLQAVQKTIQMLAPKVAMVTAILLVGLILLGSGVVLVADKAKPGDSLYPIDLAAEQLHMALTFSFPSRLELQMDNASERLVEAVALAEAGKTVNLAGVLANYDRNLDTLATAIQGYGKSETADALTASLDQALAVQTTTFDILATIEGDRSGFNSQDCALGNAGKAHPVGSAIAGTFKGTNYDTVMSWYCGGNGFGTVVMALEAAEASLGSASCNDINGCAEYYLNNKDSVSWGEVLRGDDSQPSESPEDPSEPGSIKPESQQEGDTTNQPTHPHTKLDKT